LVAKLGLTIFVFTRFGWKPGLAFLAASFLIGHFGSLFLPYFERSSVVYAIMGWPIAVMVGIWLLIATGVIT
jgi:hypothetical protein